jgi:hypothetical protein
VGPGIDVKLKEKKRKESENLILVMIITFIACGVKIQAIIMEN